MCGDCCAHAFYAFLCCFLPCLSKQGSRHETTCDQEETPRPVQSKSKAHKTSATAKVGASLQQRVSAQQAHTDIVADLCQPMDGKQTAALFRLRTAFSTKRKHLSPDFFAPVIKDLDTVLFNGCLGDWIHVDWVDMPATSRRMLRGVSLPCGISRISKVKIRLNTAMFEASTKEEIWGTVVHEMMHAYLALMSGWRGMLMKHQGSPFEECCRAAVGRLALEELEVLHVL